MALQMGTYSYKPYKWSYGPIFITGSGARFKTEFPHVGHLMDLIIIIQLGGIFHGEFLKVDGHCFTPPAEWVCQASKLKDHI